MPPKRPQRKRRAKRLQGDEEELRKIHVKYIGNLCEAKNGRRVAKSPDASQEISHWKDQHNAEEGTKFISQVWKACQDYDISVKKIARIADSFKFVCDSQLFISKIEKEPLNFINFKTQYLPFPSVNKICKSSKTLTMGHLNRGNYTLAWALSYFHGGDDPFKERYGMYVKLKDIDAKWKTFISPSGDCVEEFKPDIQPQLGHYLHNFDTQLLKKFGMQTGFVTLKDYAHLEKKLTGTFMSLFYDDSETTSETDEAKIQQHIVEFQKEENKTLTDKQKVAVTKGIMERFSIITGPPGAGKTMITQAIVGYYKGAKNFNMALMAPTGLAQKNLKLKCNPGDKYSNVFCGTIHKFVYNDFYRMAPGNEESPSKFDFEEFDMFIIDEASMIDIYLFVKIIDWCDRFDCKLILIGDKNQLPPVGHGKPFETLIESSVFHCTTLTEIQRSTGLLSENVMKMQSNQELDIYNDFDNKVMCFNHQHDMKPEPLRKILIGYMEKYKGKKYHFVTPQKEKAGGYVQMNTILQDLINPKQNAQDMLSVIETRQSNGIYNTAEERMDYREYRVGDKVCCTENDNAATDIDDVEAPRVNGDIGYIVLANPGKGTVEVKYEDDHIISYSIKSFIKTHMLFYASSIHKMQGSECDVIIVIMSNEHQYMWGWNPDRKKLIYTAISRGKQVCEIVGSDGCFETAQTYQYIPNLTYFMQKDLDGEWDFVDDE